MTSGDWIARLLDAGFERTGYWTLDEDARARFQAEIEIPIKPGVYAHVVNGTICYVGSAQRGLRRRLRHYEITEIRRTAFRVRELVTDKLRAGADVIVLTVVPGPVSWSGLPIDAIAGLEEGLIREIQPVWNIRGLGAIRRAAINQALEE